MTKLEKTNQKVANKIFHETLKENRKRAKKFAQERELEETVLFHAKCIEKIYRRELPKNWKLKVTIQVLDEQDTQFCSSEAVAPKGGIHGQIEQVTTDILRELLDKDNLNFHIHEQQSATNP